MILYRPVGLPELRLIFESGLKTFPPRLPEQPIFYPVLNRGYARQIASEWNTKSESFAGYVTKFAVDDAYIHQFERHIVGGREHEEFWIPAERLKEFNRYIVSPINIVDAYFGKDFSGFIAENAGLKGKDAIAQFNAIANSYKDSPMDMALEIDINKTAIFLNFPFWLKYDFINKGISKSQYKKTLEFIKFTWSLASPTTPLGVI